MELNCNNLVVDNVPSMFTISSITDVNNVHTWFLPSSMQSFVYNWLDNLTVSNCNTDSETHTKFEHDTLLSNTDDDDDGNNNIVSCDKNTSSCDEEASDTNSIVSSDIVSSDNTVDDGQLNTNVIFGDSKLTPGYRGMVSSFIEWLFKSDAL